MLFSLRAVCVSAAQRWGGAASIRLLAARSVLFALMIAGAHYGTILAHQMLRNDGSTSGPLSIPSAQLTLGRVHESDAYEHRLDVSNHANQAVKLVSFYTSCDCASVRPSADVVLQPNETKTFEMKLLARGCLQRGAEEDSVQVRLRAYWSVNGQPAQTTDWHLSALLVPALRVPGPVVEFGTQSNRQPRLQRSLEIEAAETVARVECESSAHWDVEAIRDDGEATKNRFRITIRAADGRAFRSVSERIRLIPVSGDGRRLPAKSLEVSGEVVPDVLPNPRQIHYGRQLCASAATESVCLRSLTNRRFQVLALRPGSADVTVTPAVTDGNSWSFSVRQRFVEAGDQETKIDVDIRDEDGSEYTVTMPVRYCGELP